jgi:simple sugar transport system permease protein
MTPLLCAATGGLYTGLAGMLNIALEGMLLAGAFAAIAALSLTGSVAAAIIAALIASSVLALLTAFSTLKLKSNVFIAGLAANLLAGGLTVVLSQRLFNTRGVVPLRDFAALPVIDIPLLKDIPFIGALVSGYSPYTYAALLLLPISWLIIYKTPFGYRLRACEKHADVLHSLGIESDRYRYAAFLISGLCCGIGGSFLSLNLGAFVPNMSAGKGWIALVIMLLARRSPLDILIAAFVYGLAEAFSNYAQGIINIPSELILAMPYVITLLAICAASILTVRKAHAEKARRPATH